MTFYVSENSIWQTLGIDKTANTREIKKAYASKLKELDIETQSEEYQSLRTAFENAKYFAAIEPQEAALQKDDSSQESLSKKVSIEELDQITQNDLSNEESLLEQKDEKTVSKRDAELLTRKLLGDLEHLEEVEVINEIKKNVIQGQFSSLKGQELFASHLLEHLSESENISVSFFKALENIFGWENEVTPFQVNQTANLHFSICKEKVYGQFDYRTGEFTKDKTKTKQESKGFRPPVFLICFLIYLVIKFAFNTENEKPKVVLLGTIDTAMRNESQEVVDIYMDAIRHKATGNLDQVANALENGIDKTKSTSLKYKLAMFYENELNDTPQAINWLIRAINEDHTHAHYQLAKIYNKTGDKLSLIEASKLLEVAVERGHPSAAELLLETRQKLEKIKAQPRE